MGGCLSCCCGDTRNYDYRTPPLRHSGFTRSSSPLFDPNTCRQEKQGTNSPLVCELCGAAIDPALFDGHKEVCRANHLRLLLAKNAALLSDANLRPSSSNTRLRDDSLAAEEKELCVVCMDRPRCYAFLPCGHISCCEECTKLLDQCPLCRQPREGLCYVSANVAWQYECKHCHELIAPTLFDGHREVCGLRQRQKQQEAEAEAAAAKAKAEPSSQLQNEEGVEGVGKDNGGNDGFLINTADSPLGTSPQKESDGASVQARSHAHVCLECGKRYNQLVVCVPCGHRVLCYSCAKKRTTCPVCVSEIHDTIVAFD